MKRTYGYDSYHGRSRTRNILTALIVLLLAVLAAAVAFFLLAQRYIVYTDDGQAHLELPFLQKAVSTPAPAPVESHDIVIITPDPTPTPTPTPEPAVKAVWLLRGAITDGRLAEQVAQAGGNAVVFNMKADDGTLGYVSSLPQAISLNSSEAKPGLNDAIKAITDSGLYTIARVSCFKDNKAPRNDNSLAIKTNSGYNWQDPQKNRWMNVSVGAAQEYVIGVCRELAELGFDEILLENSGYPTEGNLHYIKKGEAYDPDVQFDRGLAAPVGEFYAALKEAMKDYPDTKISYSAGAGVLSKEGDLSGQTPFMLGEFAHRVYVPAPESEDAYASGLQVLAETGFTEDRLVYILPGGESALRWQESVLVKPWETPPPALTPPPSLPTAAPEPSAEPTPAPEPSAEPEETPTPLWIP